MEFQKQFQDFISTTSLSALTTKSKGGNLFKSATAKAGAGAVSNPPTAIPKPGAKVKSRAMFRKILFPAAAVLFQGDRILFLIPTTLVRLPFLFA